jgi:lipoprotein-releasing system permease protein
MDKALPDTRPFAGFEWMLAFRYLRPQRKEGFISVTAVFSFLGIMLGVATLIVVMAVLNGFRIELRNQILGFSGHATLYRPDLSAIENYQPFTESLSKVPGVTRVVGYVEGQVLASSARGSRGALVRGLSEADLLKVPTLVNRDLHTAIGNPEQEDATPGFDGFDKSGGVLIGEGMSRRLQLALGGNLNLLSPEGPETVMGSAPTSRDFPVVGIFKLGMSDFDDNVVYMPLAEAQDFFQLPGSVSLIELMVSDPDRITDQVPDIRAAVGEGFWLQTWQERNQAFFQGLMVERNVMFMVVGMVVLVAALNIISGLIMLVRSKSSNIAILRTMGATAGSIQRIFFICGSFIGIAGTLCGFLLGLVICWNADRIRNAIQWISGVDVFNPDMYYLARVPVKIDSAQTYWVVAMALTLSVLATLYPSWRAAKLDPVEALRYE